jgi:hypothetical protein
MLELVVLALPILLAFFVVQRLRRASRRSRDTFAAEAAARGWALPDSGELRLSVPAGRHLVQLEPFRERVGRAHRVWLAGRVVGLGHAPDAWIREAASVSLSDVPPGMVEVALEPWFTRHFRAFAHDPEAFRAWCGEDVRRALARSRVIKRLEVSSGTLTLRASHLQAVPVLAQILAVATALCDPEARPKLDVLDVPESSGAGLIGLALAFLAPVFFIPIAVALAPVSDLPGGRALATPVLCPHGGTPETVRRNKNAWSVQCRASDVVPEAPGAPEIVPGCRFPTLTATVLSIEVLAVVYVALLFTFLRVRRIVRSSFRLG